MTDRDLIESIWPELSDIRSVLEDVVQAIEAIEARVEAIEARLTDRGDAQ